MIGGLVIVLPGVVNVTLLLGLDRLPAASRACTVKAYAVPAFRLATVKLVPVV